MIDKRGKAAFRADIKEIESKDLNFMPLGKVFDNITFFHQETYQCLYGLN